MAPREQKVDVAIY